MTFRALNMSAEKLRPADKLKNQKLQKNTYFSGGSDPEQSLTILCKHAYGGHE